LLDRQVRQESSLEARTRPWSGRWHFALVRGERRDPAARADLRQAMQVLRLGALRDGVWLRPDNLDGPRPAEASAVVAAQCVVALGRLEEGTDGAEVAREVWDVEAWADDAEALRRRLWALEPGEGTLADGFVLSADVLRQFQADPLLPPELLPGHWPGPALRSEYAAWDAAYRRVLRDFLRA
jgi:phenylacetic acid degradation operon negative regulatory protein